MTMSNIPAGKLLTKEDRQVLAEELSFLREDLKRLHTKNTYTDEYTPWERVEHSADISACDHDIEAIEISLTSGRRIY